MRTLFILLVLFFSFEALSQTSPLVGKSLRVGLSGTFTKSRVTGLLNADSTSGVTLVSARVVTNEINKTKAEIISTIQTNAFTTITATVLLDFPNVAAGTSQSLTFTLTGVAAGDVIAMGASSDPLAGRFFTALVTITNTVTITLHNFGATGFDPAEYTFKVIVLK